MGSRERRQRKSSQIRRPPLHHELARAAAFFDVAESCAAANCDDAASSRLNPHRSLVALDGEGSTSTGVASLRGRNGESLHVRVVQSQEREDLNMHRVRWVFTEGSETFQVELRHGRTSGIRKIYVNRQLQERIKSVTHLVRDQGSSHEFPLPASLPDAAAGRPTASPRVTKGAARVIEALQRLKQRRLIAATCSCTVAFIDATAGMTSASSEPMAASAAATAASSCDDSGARLRPPLRRGDRRGGQLWHRHVEQHGPRGVDGGVIFGVVARRVERGRELVELDSQRDDRRVEAGGERGERCGGRRRRLEPVERRRQVGDKAAGVGGGGGGARGEAVGKADE